MGPLILVLLLLAGMALAFGPVFSLMILGVALLVACSDL